MWPHTYQLAGEVVQRIHDLLGHPQFGRRAAPKEIAWRRCDDGKVGLKIPHSAPNFIQR